MLGCSSQQAGGAWIAWEVEARGDVHRPAGAGLSLVNDACCRHLIPYWVADCDIALIWDSEGFPWARQAGWESLECDNGDPRRRWGLR